MLYYVEHCLGLQSVVRFQCKALLCWASWPTRCIWFLFHDSWRRMGRNKLSFPLRGRCFSLSLLADILKSSLVSKEFNWLNPFHFQQTTRIPEITERRNHVSFSSDFYLHENWLLSFFACFSQARSLWLQANLYSLKHLKYAHVCMHTPLVFPSLCVPHHFCFKLLGHLGNPRLTTEKILDSRITN